MTNPARTRTVQNILENPGTGKPIAGRMVSIRLNTVGFIDAGGREKLRTTYATTDATGLWQADLEVNDDIDPAGTYYTVSEFSGVMWTFIVPAGSGAIDLRDCLVTDPANPNPILTSNSVPAGGTTGQVLAKADDGDFDTAWVDQTGGGGGGTVASVNGRTGVVVLTATDVGADAAGAAASAQTAAIAAADTYTDAQIAAIPDPDSTDITDATATGRAVLTAASQAAARTAIGAGTSSFSGAYGALTGLPTLGTASSHAVTDFDTSGAAAAAQAAAASDATSKVAVETTRAASAEAALRAVPSHAGTRAGNYDAFRSLYNATPSATLRLRAALSAALARTGLCRIKFVGDSITAGYLATPGSTDPVVRLGSILAGMGHQVGYLIHMYNAMTADNRFTATGGGWPGAASKTFPWPSFTGTGGTLTLTGVGGVCEIVTRGDTAAFSYSIDGAAPVTITPSGSATPQVITVSGLRQSQHTLVITSAAGASYVCAAGFRPASGIVLENAGLTSTTTADWVSGAGAFGPAWSLLHANNVVHDAVLVELGSNDATSGVNLATYTANLESLIDQADAAGASVIPVAPNRPSTGTVATATFNTYLSAIYDAADARGVPLLDLADRFGLYTAYQADGLAADVQHPNVAGYAFMAWAWAGALDAKPLAAPARTGASCRVYALSTSQIVANGAAPTLDVNTVEFNDDTGLYTVDLAANTVTVHQSGTYLCAYSIKYTPVTTGGYRSATIFVNATFTRESEGVAQANLELPVRGSDMFRANAGDAVKIVCYADGGTGTGVSVPIDTSSIYATGFALTYLGS